MSYEVFKSKISALIARAGGNIKVWFNNDANGRFFANCSDGTTFIGNEACLKVKVRWSGRNHQSIITL